jgi:hypothetical protein
MEEARGAVDVAADRLADGSQIPLLWECSAVYEALQEPERAEEVRRIAYGICTRRPILIIQLLNYLRNEGRAANTAWVIQAAERDIEQPVIVLAAIARHHLDEDRSAEVERILNRCIAIAPS